VPKSRIYYTLHKYWRLCLKFYSDQDYPLAAFFAATLIEETGKAVMIKEHEAQEVTGGVPKKTFRDHQAKYLEAVSWALFVNLRVTRIYGNIEKRFGKWFKKGRIFKIRNAGLYIEKGKRGFHTPDERVSKTTAFIMVCFAGEIFGEIQGDILGTGPEEFKEIIQEIDRFIGENAATFKEALKEIPV